MALGLIGLGAWGAEPDPEEVRRRMEIYMREEKPAPVSKPTPKPAPTVNYDHEAWKSAEKCGTAACFRAYLEEYPKGRYAKMARARLESEPRPATAISDIDKSRPDPSRAREELEKYSLGSLKMMGTVPMGGELWALVLAPDNVVHRVGKNNYLGTNYGKIISVTERRIELKEIISDGLGRWQERDAFLSLTQ